ncbi:MAG TPA: hypothetical protein VKR31_15055 [Rhizomicrobium sp.]|nr:hypothetical protein [Rhizomicrobium sp.]
MRGKNRGKVRRAPNGYQSKLFGAEDGGPTIEKGFVVVIIGIRPDLVKKRSGNRACRFGEIGRAGNCEIDLWTQGANQFDLVEMGFDELPRGLNFLRAHQPRMTKLVGNQKCVAARLLRLSYFGGKFIRQARAKCLPIRLRQDFYALETFIVPPKGETPQVQLYVTCRAQQPAVKDTLARQPLPIAGCPNLGGRRSRFFRPDMKDQFHGKSHPIAIRAKLPAAPGKARHVPFLLCCFCAAYKVNFRMAGVPVQGR